MSEEYGDEYRVVPVKPNEYKIQSRWFCRHDNKFKNWIYGFEGPWLPVETNKLYYTRQAAEFAIIELIESIKKARENSKTEYQLEQEFRYSNPPYIYAKLDRE